MTGWPRSSKPSVGVRELKTHAARIVREVRETRASYVLTHRGHAVGVILPLEAAGGSPGSATQDEADAAWAAFESAGRRLEQRFRRGVSGVQVLSDGRR